MSLVAPSDPSALPCINLRVRLLDTREELGLRLVAFVNRLGVADLRLPAIHDAVRP
jgi:hypothetical protein